MKKYLLSLIALVAFTWMADAQITITKSETGRAEQVLTLSSSWSWIYRQNDAYYLVMKSDNQFEDDAYWMLIGNTRDKCEESLSSLLDLANTIGEADSYYVDNGEGKSFRVTQYKALGMKGLKFWCSGYAGSSFLLASNINKALKWIRKNLE